MNSSYLLMLLTKKLSLFVYIYRIISDPFLFLVINHPTPQSLTLTSIRFFSSFDSLVLVGDLNCKHTNWNCISVDRNCRTLLSYCLSQNIAFYYPDHPTYFHTSFQTSALVFLSQSTVYCPNNCLSLHSLLTIIRWYLRFYYDPPFPNLVRFSIIRMLNVHYSVPH